MAADAQDIAIEEGDLRSWVLHRSPHADGGRDVADGPSESEIVAEFAAEHDSPGRARRLVVAALRQRGYEDVLVQDAAVVLTELATNAVLHAHSPFSISIRNEDSMLHVAVQDASSPVTMRDEELIPQRTHGLGLIDALSARWGVEGAPEGKVVWAELHVGAGVGRAG